MKHAKYLPAAAALLGAAGLVAAAALPARADCVYIPLKGNVCVSGPPPGGRECTSPDFTAPQPGEFAAYLGADYHGRCFVVPANTPNSLWLFGGDQVLSVWNRTSVTRKGFSSVGYGGSSQLWVAGQGASYLPFTPLSYK
jgi:hypothetical protein